MYMDVHVTKIKSLSKMKVSQGGLSMKIVFYLLIVLDYIAKN